MLRFIGSLIGSLLVCAMISAALPSTAAAQATSPFSTTQPSSRPPEVRGGDIYGGYMIGLGDILDVFVNDEENVSGRYQVNQDGTLTLPLLSAPLRAVGTTTFDLATQLRVELKKQEILREPSVTVLIVRGMTQNVTILGAVARPGTYPIEKPTTLLDVISAAGGLGLNPGNTLTITRDKPADSSSNPPATTIHLGKLMSGQEPASNLQVRAGDVVTVSVAPVVFVVGAVNRPGAFTVQNTQSQMTVMQAVAMAEGTVPTASLGKAVIVRQISEDAEREEIAVDLKQVMRGKDKDQTLLANDILFIPESGFKAGMRRVSDIAAQAAGQVTGYGLGLRIGRPGLR